MSAWRLGRCAAVVFALLALCGTISLAGVTGNIAGRVSDASGNPLSGAKVTATSPSLAASAPTDAHGYYAILNLSPDTYSVTATKDGYDPTTIFGITVQADQTAATNISLRPVAKTLGKVVTTANATVVSKTVTGDLYAVNAQTINQYQGSAGGAETLYSQNGVVGSLPGVIRSFGSGGGYDGNGTLSFRGGSTDQVGFELEGIPLNRGFDAANGTSFTTNGIGSLEVYTGGEPADAGRSMSGYINEEIRRGGYPGGADFTAATGGPAFNHTIQADVYGGTPDRRFTYYVSTLGQDQGYNFVNRSNLDNTSFALPANDPGCGAFNAQIAFNGSTSFQNCVAQVLSRPISQGAWQNFVNPYAAIRDTVGNFHYAIPHNGLSDDLQALYLVGGTETPFLYAGTGIDPYLYAEGVGGSFLGPGQLLWPSGFPYIGKPNQLYNANAFGTYTWPSSGGSTGLIPSWYVDGQTTEEAVEKLSYTHSFSSSSFLRVYAYSLFSAWNFDQATNGFLGDSYYQLHDNATGYTATYQNQLNPQNLLRLDADYTRDVTLRYNYASNFFPDASTFPQHEVLACNLPGMTLADGPQAWDPNGCQAGETVSSIGGPYAYWNDINPVNVDGAIADTLHAGNRWVFDLGLRWDEFEVPLMPLQITGPNGLAEQGQNLYGYCLHGYAYAPSEPCFGYLTNLQADNKGLGLFDVAPGAADWTNVSGSQNFTYISPRFGFTYSLSPQQVLRGSVGRYVQQPETFGNEYIGAPWFGANATIAILNRFYDPLGFTTVHNLTPQDSTNYDLSFEQDFSNTLSAKISPYFRETRGQILSIPVNPLQPTFVTGYNFGAARIYGSEFLMQKNRAGSNGLSATLAATYTNSKIRFERSLGPSYIDVINEQISNYNKQYKTSFPLFDPNGYYSPSLTQSPGGTTASYDVPWVVNLNLDEAMNGWHITPAFTYQSGNPYGDPQDFLDAHCPLPGPPSTPGNFPGCISNPTGVTPLSVGPDPYTGQFDGLGSLKGPSWMTMNLAVSHNVGRNTIASFLWTNVFTIVHNQGYAWEYPSSDQVLSYGDNTFYSFPLGLDSLTGFPNERAYYGDNYYPYAPESLMPARQFTFSLSAKL
ncbi:MAG TPA: TonB-dependent receptor [Candidatus Acidoferrales bacterium]|nr:TonB-dependent receptor [Candidatus Acidoferrales bacterium]